MSCTTTPRNVSSVHCSRELFSTLLADPHREIDRSWCTKRTPEPTLTAERWFLSVCYPKAVMSYLALKRAMAPAELHVYETGGHGFGGNIIHPPDRPLVADWMNRLETWMRYRKLLDPRP